MNDKHFRHSSHSTSPRSGQLVSLTVAAPERKADSDRSKGTQSTETDWIKRLTGLFLAIALMLMVNVGRVPPALAQASPADDPAIAAASDPPEEQPQRSTGLSADNISSEKINQFVMAYAQVLSLVNERADELRRVETEAESLSLQHSLEQEALTSIESTGLSWQEYVQLLNLANTDPAFGERIVAQLQETPD